MLNIARINGILGITYGGSSGSTAGPISTTALSGTSIATTLGAANAITPLTAANLVTAPATAFLPAMRNAAPEFEENHSSSSSVNIDLNTLKALFGVHA